jgi:endonuclease/exonuclease/phosphatase family metal-dependent hydrolase
MPEALVLASYNVHGCIGTDGRHDPLRTSKVLAGSNASIIGLQEIDSCHEDGEANADLEILASTLNLQAVSGAVRDRADGRYGNALLTSWPITDVRKVDLSVGKHEPRGALDVDLQVHEARVRVVVTHFGLKPHERRKQTAQLLSAVASDPQGADITILLGDLNEWFALGRPLRWLHRNFGWAPSLATFPSRLPLFALDRVWTQPCSALVTLRRIYNRQTRVASDHLPVVAHIDISQSRGFPASTNRALLKKHSASVAPK